MDVVQENNKLLHHAALSAIVKVGDGRGFVVEGHGRLGLVRYVVTAAHCIAEDGERLPLPPPHGGSYTEERTYKNLLAPLGEKPSVWCECLFVDPIADIAVLGSPDSQELFEQAEAYEALVEAVTPLKVAEPPSKPIAEEVAKLAEIGFGEDKAIRECSARLLSLKNEWFPCKVRHRPNSALWVHQAANGIEGGMSGSPIIAEDGTAIGIICLGSGGKIDKQTEGGPNPRLMGNLPGWFLAEIAQSEDALTEEEEDELFSTETLEDTLTENLSIYAGSMDEERFRPMAQEYLARFERIMKRPPDDYLEIEEWMVGMKFLVVEGGKKRLAGIETDKQ